MVVVEIVMIYCSYGGSGCNDLYGVAVLMMVMFLCGGGWVDGVMVVII